MRDLLQIEEHGHLGSRKEFATWWVMDILEAKFFVSDYPCRNGMNGWATTSAWILLGNLVWWILSK